MRIGVQKRRPVRSAWHTWVCVLLVGFVIHNPFVSLRHAPNSPCYDKLARNRATVGASEMQQFSPVPNSTDRPNTYAVMKAAERSETPQESRLRAIPQQVVFVQPEVIAGLWFRPPPAL